MDNSVTCDTFVDAAPGQTEEGAAVENGTIAYYDGTGQLQSDGVTYSLSQDTALNPASEDVHYVESITFPIDNREETYRLSLYINSNVMGVQFGSVLNTGESGGYQAVLTVDWDGTGEALATEPELTAPQAEEMDGLSIYRPEDGVTEEPQEQITVVQTEQTRISWPLVVLAAALIAAGIGLYIHGARRKEEDNA